MRGLQLDVCPCCSPQATNARAGGKAWELTRACPGRGTRLAAPGRPLPSQSAGCSRCRLGWRLCLAAAEVIVPAESFANSAHSMHVPVPTPIHSVTQASVSEFQILCLLVFLLEYCVLKAAISIPFNSYIHCILVILKTTSSGVVSFSWICSTHY